MITLILLKSVRLKPQILLQILLQNDRRILEEAEKYLKIFKDTPYIFNLGHGLLPETDPEKLNKLINFVKGYK